MTMTHEPDVDFFDNTDLDVNVSVPEQTKLNRILFGDKSRNATRAKGRPPKRRRDPTVGGLWRVRTLRMMLLAAMAIGVVGGTKALLFTPSASETAAADATTATVMVEPARDIGVGGFGELYISAWLGAGRSNAAVLAPYYSHPADLTAVVTGRFWASRTATVAIEEAEPGYWAVTVAADVLVADDNDVYQPGGIRYYTVGVTKTDTGFGATGLPAQVPAPPTVDAPELVIDDLVAPTGDLEPFAAALDGFFDALLAGSGDIERYIAPETTIQAIAPAPFTETEIRSLGARPEVEDPSRHLVRAEVLATDGIGNAQILQYTAVMSERSQRWEIVELVAASPVGNP